MKRLLPIVPMAMLMPVAAGAAGAATDATVERWAPAHVSSDQFESHPAFDPVTGDLYFVRSTPKFSGWRIKVSHCGTDGWSEPVDASFAGPGVEADPYFTPDGRSVYFISTRATGSSRSADLDIWRADRTATGGWSAPVMLPEPVNSGAAEWFPRPASDGWLYFGSARPGGLGGNDIWRARQADDGRWKVENLGASVNSSGDEFEPLPSPDGKTLLVEAADGYYESRRTPQGWSPRVRLGPEINANGSEVGALFSPSGKTLMFARDIGSPDSGELFVWQRGGHENWPANCPRSRAKND